ncbi:MAG TPA: hypothetical protein VFT13_08765 [Candidatus Krumholzibacteria bacterium]|nr:hypothetical protein [Candidatus Krumholzibacteria bacterium]
MMPKRLFALAVMVSGLVAFSLASDARAQASQEEAALPPEELAAEVPALDDLHDVVYQLWHDAYPEKNFALIRELLPRTDELTAKLDEAKLPGILRDKQAAWDEGKGQLKSALAALHAAAEGDDEEAMLKQTEAFHAAFEKLVRTIRPVVPALEDFHQALYPLYHYYAPDYDLAQIRAAAAAMKERVAPLAASKLSPRLAERFWPRSRGSTRRT